MAIGALIKSDAFERAELIDAELNWPRGLAIGRIAKLWARSQSGNGIRIAKRRLILDWANIEPQYADQFIELCCSISENSYIHFLESKEEDTFLIVGNEVQLTKIDMFKKRAASGGRAKAKSASSSASSRQQAVLQADDKQCLQSAPSLPSSSSSSSSYSYAEFSSYKEECPRSAPPIPDESIVGIGKLSFTPWDMKAAVWLQKAVLMVNPAAVKAQKANLEKWADVFRRMRERDKLSEEAITQVLVWVFEQEEEKFWCTVIQSAEKFRQKWDQLTAKMLNPKQKAGGSFR